MKKLFISLAALVMLAAIVFSMAIAPAVEKVETNFVTTLADPALWAENAEQGTVSTVGYPTHWYNRDVGNETTKYMTVYLPYGYTPEKKYNVLVLLPGQGMSENCYLNVRHRYERGETSQVWLKNLFDNAIADGRMKPMIVVNVNYWGATGKNGQPNMQLDSNNISKELQNDILPFLVENYSTYAAGSSRAEISAARDHFGVFGFSYTSTMIPTTIMPECLDLFAWYGASSVFNRSMTAPLETINSKIDQYPVRYYYCGCGEWDHAKDQTIPMYNILLAGTDGIVQGVNSELIVLPSTEHDAKTYDTAIYNCATNFFQDTAEDARRAEEEEAARLAAEQAAAEEAARLAAEQAAAEEAARLAAEQEQEQETGYPTGSSDTTIDPTPAPTSTVAPQQDEPQQTVQPSRTEELTRNGKLDLDTGHSDQGYIYVHAPQSPGAYLLHVIRGYDDCWYTVSSSGEWELIPVPFGSGDYELDLYERTGTAKKYDLVGSQILEIAVSESSNTELPEQVSCRITDMAQVPYISEDGTVTASSSGSSGSSSLSGLLDGLFQENTSGEDTEDDDGETGEEEDETLDVEEVSGIFHKFVKWLNPRKNFLPMWKEHITNFGSMISEWQSRLRETRIMQQILSYKEPILNAYHTIVDFLTNDYEGNVEQVFENIATNG